MNGEHYPAAADIPGQKLPYPASQAEMHPAPDSDLSNYRPAGTLTGKVALITGADSGVGRAVGRAVAIAYAMEGADVAARNCSVSFVQDGKTLAVASVKRDL